MTGGAPSRAQYRAFVSYSHKDAAAGRRLHRRLETYVLPRRLVGRPTPLGPAPARLAPVFRDREELPAHHDLSEKVRAALAASDALVVVCSPNAAASPWVTREIETFRSLHPGRPVLAALIAGEPAQAFPAALLGTGADGGAIEPLAADFRPASDGERLGLLKLVAGILDIGLDELVQRDAQRRLAQVTAVSAASVATVLAMGLLTAFALQSRAEAVRQRAAAEGLVDFMLTDLHDRLEAVGRLDILTPVNAKALSYYEQNAGNPTPGERLREAAALQALGADDVDRGDLASARLRFRTAYGVTRALLTQDEGNLDRVLAHAQSEYWMGFLAYLDRDRGEARRRWTIYLSLARRLAAAKPDDPRYLRELGYAEGNLCSAALVKPKDFVEARRACTAALQAMQQAAAQKTPPPGIWLAVANREGWLADVYHESYDWPHALEHRRRQAAILQSLVDQARHDLQLRESWVAAQRGLALLEFETGDRAGAHARQRIALAELNAMIAFDPSNRSWLQLKQKLEGDLTRPQ